MRFASADAGAGELVEAVVAGAWATPVRRNCAMGSKSGCFATGFAGSGARAGGAATIEIGAERGAAGGNGGAVSAIGAEAGAREAVCCAGALTGWLADWVEDLCAASGAFGAAAACAVGAEFVRASCFANSGAGCGPSCMKRRFETKLTKIAVQASPTSVRSGRLKSVRTKRKRPRGRASTSSCLRSRKVVTVGSTRAAARERARRLGGGSSMKASS